MVYDSELTLDNLDFKDQGGNIVLTIGEGYIGYSGNGFEPDPTYDFNQHRGEEFRISDSSNTRSLSFFIR